MRATLLYGAGDVFCTGHHAAVKAGVSPRAAVTVIGDGAVGLCAVSLDETPDGYRAMASREALKVLIRP